MVAALDWTRVSASLARALVEGTALARVRRRAASVASTFAQRSARRLLSTKDGIGDLMNRA
jgi:hypothetical protein